MDARVISKNYLAELIKNANISTHSNMEEFLVHVKEAKLSALKAKSRFITCCQQLIFECYVNKITTKLLKYNAWATWMQILNASRLNKIIDSREDHIVIKKQTFPHFWKMFSGALHSKISFNNLTKIKIMKIWLKEYHQLSPLWSLFNLQNIYNLFHHLEFDIKLLHDTILFKKGNKAEYHYTILLGKCSLWIPKKGIAHRHSNMTTIKHKWECIKVLEAPISFGELGLFSNGTGVRNATCLIDNQCLMLRINKNDYLQYIHEKIMESRNKTARFYKHLKRNSSQRNLDILTTVSSIGIQIKYLPKSKISFNKHSVYVIQKGTVILYIVSSIKSNKKTKREYLQFGAGSIIDCRTIYNEGIKQYCNEDINLANEHKDIYDRMHYTVKTDVILHEFKLQSFVDIGKFDFFSLYNIAKMELMLIIQSYKERQRKQRLKPYKFKTNLKEMRNHDPYILRLDLWNTTPQEIYQNNYQVNTEKRPVEPKLYETQDSVLEMQKNDTGSSEISYIMDNSPLPPPLKVIEVPQNELPSIFL